MKTIHIIFNAHIDPIWLWPWQAGLDEVLATCRSACDRLDAHPDLTFSRGEAWVYQQVERCDPKLFERMRAHIASGRWEIVGGWWIQPDCNAPSGFGIEKQIELGKEYFIDRFGVFPRIAFNVDSFGHAAVLPGYMRAAGQDRYVMMRPQEHEKELPSRFFRWQGYADQPEVTTFRIAGAYTVAHANVDFVRMSTNAVPEGINHTMCFLGVGDHGGGPTERLIEWCRKNKHCIEGWQLEFSTPSRFFDAIEKDKHLLPLVTGELQMHAIGCYSVYRPIKTAVRRAEYRLKQAGIMLSDGLEKPSAAELEDIKEGWKRVCFHQFHDTLGGTCLPSAYPPVLDQLGGASATADDSLHFGLRRRLNALPDCPDQRIVLYNASDRDFNDFVEFEPWIEYGNWAQDWRLVDEANTAIPIQLMHSEAICGGDNKVKRLIFKLKLAPAEMRVLHIDKTSGPFAATGANATEASLESNSGVEWTPNKLTLPGIALDTPQLVLIDDPTDTWSHDIDRYKESSVVSEWGVPTVIDKGPFMSSCEQFGQIGESTLRAEWRVYANEPFCDLLLTVHWRAKHKMLKLVLGLPGAGESRIDGVMGGSLPRENSGQEVPLCDWTLVDIAGQPLGIVCPDVFAADTTAERVRFTLLRSAILAHHDPDDGTAPRGRISDQGVNEFRFRFIGGSVTEQILADTGCALQSPPVIADLTRGMPSRFDLETWE